MEYIQVLIWKWIHAMFTTCEFHFFSEAFQLNGKFSNPFSLWNFYSFWINFYNQSLDIKINWEENVTNIMKNQKANFFRWRSDKYVK